MGRPSRNPGKLASLPPVPKLIIQEGDFAAHSASPEPTNIVRITVTYSGRIG